MANSTNNTQKRSLKKLSLKILLLALLLCCCVLPLLTLIYKNRFIISINPYTLMGGTGVTGRSLSISLNDAPLYIYEFIPGGFYPTPNQYVIAVPETDMTAWLDTYNGKDPIYLENLPSTTKVSKVDDNGYYYIPAVSGDLAICFMRQGISEPGTLYVDLCVKSSINKGELLIADYENVSSIMSIGPEIRCNRACPEFYRYQITGPSIFDLY